MAANQYPTAPQNVSLAPKAKSPRSSFKLMDESRVQAAFRPFLKEGETLRFTAIGEKLPNFFLLVGLLCLGTLPGLAAASMRTKNYAIGLTDKRFIVLQVKSAADATVLDMNDYSLDELRGLKVKTSTNFSFTRISISDSAKPFLAKFHRAFSKTNHGHSIAIAKSISCL